MQFLKQESKGKRNPAGLDSGSEHRSRMQSVSRCRKIKVRRSDRGLWHMSTARGRSAWRIKGVITGSNHDKKQTLLRMRLKGSRQKRRAEDMCMTPKHFWGPVCCFRWSYIAAVAHTGSTSIWLSIGKDS